MAKKVSITADGDSAAVYIDKEDTSDGDALLTITGTFGGSTAMALKASRNSDKSRPWVVKQSGTAVSATEPSGFVVAAGLYYFVTVTDYSGSSSIEMEVSSS